MAESIKAGGGSLGPNRDRTEERHPNYKGKIVTDIDLPAGSTIWLSGWVRDDPGGKWISLAAQVSAQPQSRSQTRRFSSTGRQQQQQGRSAPPRQSSYGNAGGYAGNGPLNELDDDVPF